MILNFCQRIIKIYNSWKIIEESVFRLIKKISFTQYNSGGVTIRSGIKAVKAKVIKLLIDKS